MTSVPREMRLPGNTVGTSTAPAVMLIPMESRKSAMRCRRGSQNIAVSITEGLHLDLRAQFDDLIRRQAEEAGGARGIANHPGEESFAPDGHAGAASSDERLAAEEVAGGHGVEFERRFLHALHGGRQIGLLHESETEDEAIDAVAEIAPLVTLVVA